VSHQKIERVSTWCQFGLNFNLVLHVLPEYATDDHDSSNRSTLGSYCNPECTTIDDSSPCLHSAVCPVAKQHMTMPQSWNSFKQIVAFHFQF